MGFFDLLENVQQYLKLADGFDGKEIIARLNKYLAPGSSVLELGMGSGKDLDILLKKYKAAGSDLSDVFLDMYQEKHPNADLLKLDAVTLQTERKFDCIYSNKVLVHLSRNEFVKSLQRQLEVLENNGLAVHTLWRGTGKDEHHDLLFTYYEIDELRKIIPPQYEILEMELYKEMESEDSIFLILKKQ